MINEDKFQELQRKLMTLCFECNPADNGHKNKSLNDARTILDTAYNELRSTYYRQCELYKIKNDSVNVDLVMYGEWDNVYNSMKKAAQVLAPHRKNEYINNVACGLNEIIDVITNPKNFEDIDKGNRHDDWMVEKEKLKGYANPLKKVIEAKNSIKQKDKIGIPLRSGRLM